MNHYNCWPSIPSEMSSGVYEPMPTWRSYRRQNFNLCLPNKHFLGFSSLRGIWGSREKSPKAEQVEFAKHSKWFPDTPKTKLVAGAELSWDRDKRTPSIRQGSLPNCICAGSSRVFSSTTVPKHQFFGAQLSSQCNSHIHTWLLEKP